MALVLKRDLDQPLSLKELDEVWVRGRPTFVGLVVMGTVLVFIHREFGGRAPPMLLYPWLAFMTAGIAIVLGMIIAYFIELLRTRITGRFWRNCINVVSFFFCSGVAISVWVLLPFADDLLRILMIFLYMWFVAMVMLANADRITMVGANATRHARGSRILIGARLRQGRTDLMVIDDGKGILATDVERLFDDYSQGSDHGVRSPGGFGLGLASARRMAELLDSRLALDSRWQRGSAFVVTIPGGTRIQTEEAACKAA